MVKCIAAWSTFKRIDFINIFSSPRNVWKNVILTLHNPLPLISVHSPPHPHFWYHLNHLKNSWQHQNHSSHHCRHHYRTHYHLRTEGQTHHQQWNTHRQTWQIHILCLRPFWLLLWIMNVNILHVLLNSREIKMQQDKSKQKKAKLFLLYWLCKRVAIKWWKQGI